MNMAKSEVIYVPIKGSNNCIYPVYVPVIIREPQVYKATGRLSQSDYEASKNNLAGNPALIPLLLGLAPLIPGVIKGVKKIFNKSEKPRYRATGDYSSRGYHGYYDRKAGYIPTNPNIKSLKDLQALYDKYD
jgi:hypothetical protein